MSKTAKLYRMVMDKHICPYGLKSLDLLKSKGYEVEDHHLTSREQTDLFKKNMMSKRRRKPLLMASVSVGMTISKNSLVKSRRV